MSVMNPLPPQAYTKETLVQAYAWLQSQSESIKEMATNPDILVSLFLKAKLQGDAALERPSIQNFKSELKNLAGMMGEFEVVETPPMPAAPGTGATSTSSATFRFRSSDFKDRQPQKLSQAQLSFETQPPPAQQPQAAPSTSSNTLSAQMDSRSMDMIQEVKNRFNLSSDTEAMRLLIATGYNKVKDLFK